MWLLVSSTFARVLKLTDASLTVCSKVLTVLGFMEGDVRLLENPGVKTDAAVVVNGIMNLDRMAAHFTILDVRLASYRCVQYHGDFLPAIRTGKDVFHEYADLLR